MATVTAQFRTPADGDVALALVENRAPSVGHLYRDRVAKTPKAPAFMYAVVGPGGDDWRTDTWEATKARTDAYAGGLLALGIEPEERVANASGTRLEWAHADLAVMSAGAATTTIYPTTIADDVAFILSDSGSRIVFAENAAQVDKLRSIREQTPAVKAVVVIDPAGVELDDWVMTLADLEESGRAYVAEHPGAIDERIDGCGPDQLATIIYTSGTTGRPKGVRLLMAGSTRSSTTSPWCSRPSWVRHPAFSRRLTAGSRR